MSTPQVFYRTMLVLFLARFSFTICYAQTPMQPITTTAPISGIAVDARSGNRPLENASFKVVAGTTYSGQLPVSAFRTDEQGRFFLELPPGAYSIVEAERPETFVLKKTTLTERWDNRCRKKLWQTPRLVLKIESLTAQNVRLDRAKPDEESCLK